MAEECRSGADRLGWMTMKFVIKGRKQEWVAESWISSLEDKGGFDGGANDENTGDQPTGDGQPVDDADHTDVRDPS